MEKNIYEHLPLAIMTIPAYQFAHTCCYYLRAATIFFAELPGAATIQGSYYMCVQSADSIRINRVCVHMYVVMCEVTKNLASNMICVSF